MARRIMIMAGGTGGHVFPALAVARELQARGVEITWLGTRRGIEADIIPQAGIPIEWINVAGLRGKSALSLVLAPFRLVAAVVQALGVFLRCRPMAVLGMGGFASGPGGLVSWLLRLPLVIHEQNAVAGLTNRILARLARLRLEAFPGALPDRLSPKMTGNPVREEIAALGGPLTRFQGRQGPLRLLVVGGSLGAKVLNDVVPQAAALLSETLNLEVFHQTGRNNLDAARQQYASAGVAADVVPFIEDMAGAYGRADIVLCRAGALTVAELAAAGVASILVPFPHAVDDHQTRNAGYLSEAGAALLMPQPALTAQSLAEKITQLVNAPGACDGLDLAGIEERRRQLACMAYRARQLARPDATRQVADLCMELIND